MEYISSRPTTHVGLEAQQPHLFNHQQLCINTRGLFLIWTHTSHHISLSLSLLHRQEALLLLHRKGLFSHTCGRNDAKFRAATSDDHHSLSKNCVVGESDSPWKSMMDISFMADNILLDSSCREVYDWSKDHPILISIYGDMNLFWLWNYYQANLQLK